LTQMIGGGPGSSSISSVMKISATGIIHSELSQLRGNAKVNNLKRSIYANRVASMLD
jgi:hypothetical protein